MSKVVHPFNPGDLLLDWSDYLGYSQTVDTLYEDMLKEETPGDGTSFVYPVRVYEIMGIERKRYMVKSPYDMTTNKRKATIEHRPTHMQKLDRQFFDKLIALDPIKAKIGDKLINPYMKFTPEQITDGKVDEYNLDAYHHVLQVDSEGHVRCAQGNAFLIVDEIYSEVSINIKYKKPLLEIEHYYVAAFDNDEIHIGCTFTKDQIEHYESFNNIWNNVCTSPSQEN